MHNIIKNMDMTSESGNKIKFRAACGSSGQWQGWAGQSWLLVPTQPGWSFLQDPYPYESTNYRLYRRSLLSLSLSTPLHTASYIRYFEASKANGIFHTEITVTLKEYKNGMKFRRHTRTMTKSRLTSGEALLVLWGLISARDNSTTSIQKT